MKKQGNAWGGNWNR